MVESQIAKELNLSRVPVREALQRLESEGMLANPGAGRSRTARFIEDLSPEDVIAHYEVREAIEGMAARLAAKNMTGWQIDRLRDVARQYTSAVSAGDGHESARRAVMVHRHLLENCGNTRLLAVWEAQDLAALSTHTQTLEQKITAYLPSDRDLAEEFTPVIDAIAAHDPDRAERAMREFIGSMTSAVRRALKSEPE